MVDMGLADDERLTVAAALATLQYDREVDIESIRTAAMTARRGDENGNESVTDRLFEVLIRLPGVIHSGDRLRYTLTPDGYESWE